MSEKFFATAEAIEDDVLIRIPDEFGIEDGEECEIKKRVDGVIIINFPNLNQAKK